jgi:hypothetical protein
MPTSLWIALALIVASTWLVARVFRRPAAAREPPAAPPRSAGTSAYAPPSKAPPPQPPTGMRVMSMTCHGFLAIEDATGRREEPLPASPLGEGEFPMGLWVAPDHTVFAVGKQYTGRPGPDDGAVWRRDPDGTWTIAYRLPGRVLGAVTGTASDDVVVATMGGVVWWNGTTWRDTTLPYPMMWKVWRDDGQIVAQAFDASVAFTFSRGVATARTPTREPDRDRYTHAVDGTTYRIFDRSEEVGERTLDPAEELEIRGELAQLQQLLARDQRHA